MRTSTTTDRTNIDRIGSADHPGLRINQLTRNQHRARLEPEYKASPAVLEALLDKLYPPTPKSEFVPNDTRPAKA